MRLPNSPSLALMRMSGCSQRTSLSNTQVSRRLASVLFNGSHSTQPPQYLASFVSRARVVHPLTLHEQVIRPTSAKRPVRMVAMPGVFSGSISLRRSNNSSTARPKSHRSGSRRCSRPPKNSTSPSDCHIGSSASSLERSITLLRRSTTWRRGFLSSKSTSQFFALHITVGCANSSRELVSASNCTDYQTRELEVRFGVKKGGKNVESDNERKQYVHALNAVSNASGNPRR